MIIPPTQLAFSTAVNDKKGIMGTVSQAKQEMANKI